jgi:Phage integrase family
MTDTSSTIVNRTLRRLPNSAYRVREYLTEKEVDRLIEAAKRRGRNGARDAAAILLAYRHGLRASELCSLIAIFQTARWPLRSRYVATLLLLGPLLVVFERFAICACHIGVV